MIILTDTNCVIQIYFLIGDALLRNSKAPKFEIHSSVKGELLGLSKSKTHIGRHCAQILRLFPVTKFSPDINYLNDEKEYLRTQYAALKKSGKIEYRQDPSDTDLTILAVASIQGCAIATLEHSLLGLARATYDETLTYTLAPIVEKFLKVGILTIEILQENLKNFPVEEKIRNDDKKAIDQIIDRVKDRLNTES